MEVNDKKFCEIQPLLLSLVKEPDIKAFKMINGLPDDIGELSFNCFIKATGLQDLSYNAVAIISCFCDVEIEKLQIMKCEKILPTYKFYVEQINKFVSLLSEIDKKYETPKKYTIQLQEQYGWFAVVRMLSNDDLSKHKAILDLPLYDIIASLKMQLDKNYSEYLKLKSKI